MMPYLSKRIRFARQKAGLTQTQVADKLGISQPAVAQWETATGGAERIAPCLESLVAFAKITRTPVQWFLEDAPFDPLDRIPPLLPTPPSRRLPEPITKAAVEAAGDSIRLGIGLTDLNPVTRLRSAFVGSRELHTALGSELSFAAWWADRLEMYPFQESLDYSRHSDPTSQAPLLKISLEMAKGLALLENSARGFACWRGLVSLEAQLKDIALALQPTPPAPARTAPVTTTRTE